MSKPTPFRTPAPRDRIGPPAREASGVEGTTPLAGIDEFSAEGPGSVARFDRTTQAPDPDALALVPSLAQPPAAVQSAAPGSAERDAIGAAATESDRSPTAGVPDATPGGGRRWLLVGLAVLAIVQTPFLGYWALTSAGLLGSRTGTVGIETDPPGLEVSVDGKPVGRSPVELTLAEGTRSVVLRQGTVSRTIAVAVRRGETVRHRFEFVAPAAAAGVSTGTLEVTSEPAGAALALDGVARGVTPMTVPELATGVHTVGVRFTTATVEQRVEIAQGVTASLHIVAPPAPTSAVGWLSVDVASPLQIFEQDRLVGTTNIGRLLLPVGVHVLDFVSDELGFRAQRTVTVRPGAATDVRLELPAVTLSINAQPWAEVFVDGERVGETPLGTLSRPVGRHEVVLRHPELGERRRTITLTTNGPNRISVDMRRP